MTGDRSGKCRRCPNRTGGKRVRQTNRQGGQRWGWKNRSEKAGTTAFAVLVALSVSHLLNDTIQSLIAAVYPVLKDVATPSPSPRSG